MHLTEHFLHLLTKKLFHNLTKKNANLAPESVDTITSKFLKLPRVTSSQMSIAFPAPNFAAKNQSLIFGSR